MVISKKLQSNFETGCFTVNLLHFFKTSVSINTSGGLLLQPIFPANIYLFKSTIETLEKGVKYVRILTSFWYFYCELLTYFTPFSSVSNVDFEQVNISWARPIYSFYTLKTPENQCFSRSRNSRSQMFFKIAVFKNFANFTGKHLVGDSL